MRLVHNSPWTAYSLLNFIVATYPEVQKRAQAEIDAVVGTERLPDFGDRFSLPYIEAVYGETLQWRPVTPLSEFCKDRYFTSHHQ